MRPLPRISIITPSYNQGRFIEETITSVLSQDYDNVEYIVMDGGSTDETVSILERYDAALDYWVSVPDEGQSDAIERGFARASGDVLAWLNSDDMLAPGALSAVAQAFATSDADIVAGVVSVQEGGRLLYHHRTGCPPGALAAPDILDLEHRWMAGRYFYQPEVFFTRDVYRRAGGRIDRSLHYSMDYDLWLRCAVAGARILPIDTELARFRMHADQKTSSVEAFVPELTRHANAARLSAGMAPMPVPAAKAPGRVARIGLVNDFGFHYGAGRAHRRMAECLAAAQYEVTCFAFRDDLHDGRFCSFPAAVEAMQAAGVDAIIVGNLHGAFPEGIDLAPLAAVAPLLLVTHDFFPFTGRCPYPMGCDGYLLVCPPACPTRDQYPVIPYDAIPDAQARKLGNLSNERIHVLANSRYMERHVRRMMAVKMPGDTTPSRLHYVPLSIPEAAFRPGDRSTTRAELGVADDDFMVMTVSSAVMDRRKGFIHVVEACRLAAVPRLRMFALGWVDPSSRLPDVTYLGHVDDDARLARCFTAADVFVSAPADETFGQVFAEAALCGCPSIAYDVGGVGEVVVPDSTGWLVDRNDIAGLAQRLRDYAGQDAGGRDAVRRRTQRHAAARWGAPTFLAAANDVLRRVVDDPDVTIPMGVQYDGIRSLPIVWARGYAARPTTGFHVPEGPFAEHGIDRRLQWLVIERGEVELFSPTAATALVTLTIANVHVAKEVTLRIGDGIVAHVRLAAEPWSVFHTLDVAVELPRGTSTLVIEAPGAISTPGRDLHLAVFGVVVARTDHEAGYQALTRHGPAGDAPVAQPAPADEAPVEALPGVIALEGFREVEGPYPDAGIPMRLAWLVNAAGAVTVAAAPSPGDMLLLDVKVPSPQTVTIFVNGRRHSDADLLPDEWERPTRIALPIEPGNAAPAYHLDLDCHHGVVDTAGDTIRLAILGASITSGVPLAFTDRYGTVGMPLGVRPVPPAVS